MKILVVSNDPALRETLTRAIEFTVANVQVVAVDHNDALINFLDEGSQAVIICEYGEEDYMDKHNQGRDTYKDITGTADESVKIARIGFLQYPYDNYLCAGFDLSDLFNLLALHPS